MKVSDGDTTEAVVPLLVERITVSKRDLVTGRVKIRTVTDTTDEIIHQELQAETVEVERVQIDRLLEAGTPSPQVRTEGDVTIIPILEEVLVMETRLLLKEELRVTRHATTTVSEIPVRLRKQRAIVERLSSEGDAITDRSED